MRLKSLQIKGFKSFPDKTTLNFDEGITGVIGPNGCGKSNIVDSIRWVIGEQKISQLRSENLQSLVFNGSKTRSASGLAEVSLTFDNTRNLLPTEFNTVTITRKYYKNGESEYRLNDVSCRLKDIHNLFLDTGVSNDSYAIIELAMVDDIIKDKDFSRRRMLEQAAGISIYKTRKREATLKLEATELDIARIEDLLFEINNQLKTLESQAKKAEKYFELKTSYKEISIELAKAALEGFNITYQKLTAQKDTETDHKIKVEAEIATEEAALEKSKADLANKEKALQLQQQDFNAVNELVRENESEKNLKLQRLHYLGEKQTGLQEFLSKAAKQINDLQGSISFTKKNISEEKEQLEIEIKNLDLLRDVNDQKRIFADEKRKILDDVRQTQSLRQKNYFDAEKKVAVGEANIQNIRRTIEQLDAELSQNVTLLGKLGIQKSEIETEINEKKTLLDQLKKENHLTREQILETQSALEDLRSELARENRTLDARQNEYDLLKSLIDNMEGYPESVKYLHNNQEWDNNAPLLSDIMYVKEEYRTAVENVLEPYLNYYVVNDLAEGLQAVHLLEENKKGKANFFLLDQLRTFESDNGHSEPKNSISALSVIEVDEKYSDLAQYLLGNVYIAEDEEALQNANGYVVLEKHGKYVKGKYALSGGSIGLFEGKKIGRVKNLEKLAATIKKQEEKVNALKGVISGKSNEVIAFNEKLKENLIQQTQEELNGLTNNLNAILNKIESQQQQQAVSTKRVNDLNVQLDDNVSGVAETRTQFDHLSRQLEEITGNLKSAADEFAEAEAAFTEANVRFNDQNLLLTKHQSKVSGLQQELQFRTNQHTEVITQRDNNQQQLQDASGDIASEKEEIKLLEERLQGLMMEKSEKEKILNEADQAYYNFRNEISARENALRQKQKSKENTDQLLNEIKDKLNELKLQLAGMKERLHVEFRIDLDTVLEEARNTETTLEELQEKSDRLKKRLENIGEINPTAIEAFTEIKKRYDFIVEQKEDLVTAKESLMQTIKEVETSANQKFLETFNKVRDNFQDVFTALFTEDDTADLVLDNPDNLAETGIDIIAKPKGKRPTSITQLSGGEKTLTATALLFAIYLIKPAPFCILDEVDAPLDDANISKFTQMIRKFSKESQFIIVTHNKMTMASVDVIYGVTMQEAGVSKLVPVDFRGLEHELAN